MQFIQQWIETPTLLAAAAAPTAAVATALAGWLADWIDGFENV